MVDYDEIRRRDDEIRDRHYAELAKVHAKLDRDLKRNILIGCIFAFVIFVSLYLYIQYY